MHPSNKKQRLRSVKLIGAIYFLALGLTNFLATLIFSKVAPLDFMILLFASLPLLLKKKELILMFGLLSSLISLYMGFACLNFNLDPRSQTSQLSYNMGYLLVVTLFLASLSLIYAGSRENRI